MCEEVLQSSEEEPDPAVEAAWAEEIRRRLSAFRAGEMKTIPVEQALLEAERLLAGDDEPDAATTPGADLSNVASVDPER